ncbi:hypothetical protein [Noviherbaspirillum pedocola]|uniref:Uncharacterized protein n=1 Tax=Noviherbaspirillum pedocola TaxID=2801341 RepID=A0A934SUU7_9BURK|nr:hypothetical protein [Noviherbaspirillum pedocola]MBK4735994.1 hypothetical protein [Noviherbaspirillum pedocola]
MKTLAYMFIANVTALAVIISYVCGSGSHDAMVCVAVAISVCALVDLFYKEATAFLCRNAWQTATFNCDAIVAQLEYLYYAKGYQNQGMFCADDVASAFSVARIAAAQALGHLLASGRIELRLDAPRLSYVLPAARQLQLIEEHDLARVWAFMETMLQSEGNAAAAEVHRVSRVLSKHEAAVRFA